MSVLQALICRLTGRSCTDRQPSSKDLIKEMENRGHRADNEKNQIRDARERGIPGAFFPSPRENHRAH